MRALLGRRGVDTTFAPARPRGIGATTQTSVVRLAGYTYRSPGTVRQEVRFCSAADGTRLAYAVHGRGRPLVRTATWLTHLEFDWESPVWRHWLEALAEGHMVLRYDERGCGLTDRDVEDVSFDTRVTDLETVIDAAGLERLSLIGISQGGPVAVAYAARHPDRVSHLVLFATFARGRLMRDPSETDREQAQLMESLIRMGWGRGLPAFRRLFTTLFIPDASPEQMQWFDDLQRVTADPDTAVRIRHARTHDLVTEEATRVACPTLVLHARDDALVPFAEGRLLATLIPGARFVALESRNHILLADEPAWTQFRAELQSFLGPVEVSTPVGLPELSSREVEVLTLVAEGLSNDEVAARLYLSVRTVERHLSNIYAKLRVSGKAARAAAAARFSRSHEPPPIRR
jgi:pimeloyl-ACP methyl ester carboxylesterase/DNA-binding CsgD family transcriptional regulator